MVVADNIRKAVSGLPRARKGVSIMVGDLVDRVAVMSRAEVTFDDDVLECPRCRGGSSDIHQIDVTMMNRMYHPMYNGLTMLVSATTPDPVMSRGEEGKIPKPVITTAYVPNEKVRNPSKDRQGLSVGFVCEHCGPSKRIELCIAQHKGSTLMYWQYEP